MKRKCRKKKFRTVVLWWLVNDTEHEQLTKRDMTIEGLEPLIKTLFPGINYYSISGFGSLLHGYVIPALKKRCPELMNAPASAIKPDAKTEVAEMLPSKGYEWEDSPRWEAKFKKALAA